MTTLITLPNSSAVTIPTLGDALEAYMEQRKDLTDETRRNYRSKLGAHCADWFNLRLTDITAEHILERHAEIEGGSAANATMRTLRAVFESSCTLYGLDHNPVRWLNRKKMWRETSKQTTYFTPDQIGGLIRAMRGQFRASAGDYMLLLLLTGLPAMSIADLRWSDCNLANGTMYVNGYTIPLSDFAWKLLVTRALGATNDHVFYSSRSTNYSQSIRKSRRSVSTACGFDVTLPDLRRTFAKTAESAGVRERELSALMLRGKVVDVPVERLRRPTQKISTALLSYAGIVVEVLK